MCSTEQQVAKTFEVRQTSRMPFGFRANGSWFDGSGRVLRDSPCSLFVQNHLVEIVVLPGPGDL